MKNLELEIYLNKLKSFFEKNPNQLKELIGDVDPTIFYNHVRIVVEDNINTQNIRIIIIIVSKIIGILIIYSLS